MAGGGASLETTPTWAIASVCTALIIIALLIERMLHLLARVIKKKKRKSLNQAMDQIMAELRKLGFISLLMTMAQQPVSKICISGRLGDTFLPCKDSSPDEDLDSCGSKGKEPLLSKKGIEQLQVLVFVLAVFHVLSCLLTLFLGEAKIRRWQSWEEETRTLDYQLHTDPHKLKLARQTTYGKRHIKWWSKSSLLLWLVSFYRQFADSVSKADYFALRNGYINSHLSRGCEFDFQKFIRRSIDQDFLMVVKISAPNWIFAMLFIFFNYHGFFSFYWVPFIPLVILLVIGMKLESIITLLCTQNNQQAAIVQGEINLKVDRSFFWFRNPQLILHIIHFVLVQNSFQLASLTWALYEFGYPSCFHHKSVDLVLEIAVGLLVQILCAYITLPLYALVSKMGSSLSETVFTNTVVEGLRHWHRMAKKKLSSETSIPLSPSPRPSSLLNREEALSATAQSYENPQSVYPCERREHEEFGNVTMEIIDHSFNNIHHDGEMSFQLWRKQGTILTRKA